MVRGRVEAVYDVTSCLLTIYLDVLVMRRTTVFWIAIMGIIFYLFVASILNVMTINTDKQLNNTVE